MDLFDHEDPVQREVERRLTQLQQDPAELLLRFDRNGDGQLDADEWRAARDVLRREITRETSTEDAFIGDRYRIVAPIGRGAQGITSVAHDTTTGAFVALKELDFDQVEDWQAMELFEKESAILRGLEHPRIPRFVDFFRLENDESIRVFLVQEYIEGSTLETLLNDGHLFAEDDVFDIAEKLLEILVYLHAHSPPVLHRDIKPANVIIRPDGELALVDFGAAQGISRSSTVIGTTGYMPVEQLMGHAVPESDLYALGATLVHLLTREHPADLPARGLSIDWAKRAHASEALRRFVDELIQPGASARFPSAKIALTALQTARGRRAGQGSNQAVVPRLDRNEQLPVTPVHKLAPYAISRTPETIRLDVVTSLFPRHVRLHYFFLAFFGLMAMGGAIATFVVGNAAPLIVLVAFVIGGGLQMRWYDKISHTPLYSSVFGDSTDGALRARSDGATTARAPGDTRLR